MNKELEDFVTSLDLPFDGKFEGNIYTIRVDSSDDFSKLFNYISLNKDLEIDGKSKATDSETKFTYTDGYYNIILSANYNKDVYVVTIEER